MIDRNFTKKTINIPETGLKDYITDLAKLHNIEYVETKIDQLSRVITHLSDDEIESDDTENLVVALHQAKIINGQQMVVLLSYYLKEKYAAKP